MLSYKVCVFTAARHQAAFEEEPDVADEAEEENAAETQKVDFEDKMGAKV